MEQGDRVVIDHESEDKVMQAIFNEVHKKQFHLAEEAPICRGRLCGEFGYLAISPTAKQVLNGSYAFHPEDDQATEELMVECSKIRQLVPPNSVIMWLCWELWQAKWKKAREDTSSSESGLHFGHYIAGAYNDAISAYHAARVSLALRKGLAINRWSRGLSAMLEKEFGNCLVSKLRAILLMEEDFNFANKGSRNARQRAQVQADA